MQPSSTAHPVTPPVLPVLVLLSLLLVLLFDDMMRVDLRVDFFVSLKCKMNNELERGRTGTRDEPVGLA